MCSLEDSRLFLLGFLAQAGLSFCKKDKNQTATVFPRLQITLLLNDRSSPGEKEGCRTPDSGRLYLEK
jgi:hypothetical protein